MFTAPTRSLGQPRVIDILEPQSRLVDSSFGSLRGDAFAAFAHSHPSNPFRFVCVAALVEEEDAQPPLLPPRKDGDGP